MKIKQIFAGLLMSATLAAGVGVAVASTTKTSTPVEAVDSFKTVYVDPNILGVANCYVYIKNADDSDNGWPGKHISTLTNYGTVTAIYNNRSTTKDFYKFDVLTSSKEIKITNSDGATYWNEWNISSVASSAWNLAQLTNWDWGYNAHHMHKIEIVDSGSTTYEYNPAEWGNYYLPTHTGSLIPFVGWYIDGDTSGTKFNDNSAYPMPQNNVNDYNFTAVYDSTSYTVTFKSEDGTPIKSESVYRGHSASCDAPSKPDDGGKHYTFDAWRDENGNDKTSQLADVQSDLTVFASYTLSYKAGRYATGTFGDCNWGVEGAVWMPYTGTQYEGQITLQFLDEFKIAYYDGSSFEEPSFVGYDKVLTTCGAFHYFSGPGNIVCYARGTYNLYYTTGDYGGGKQISIELEGSLNAEHLAAQLMGFAEYEGHCGDTDRFPAMKTIYLGLDSSEQTVFQSYGSLTAGQFRNAYDRYTAWARALGENPWATGKALKANILLGNTFENSSATLIIVIVSTLAVAAIGGYFFIRRKHEK